MYVNAKAELVTLAPGLRYLGINLVVRLINTQYTSACTIDAWYAHISCQLVVDIFDRDPKICFQRLPQ